MKLNEAKKINTRARKQTRARERTLENKERERSRTSQKILWKT